MTRLASVVHLMDDTGRSFVFGPDDEVPAWAASKITNPKAWAEAPEPSVSRLTEPAGKTAPVKRTARRKAAVDAPVHDD